MAEAGRQDRVSASGWEPPDKGRVRAMFPVTSLDRGYAAAATIADGEPRLRVGRKSASDATTTRAYLDRYSAPQEPRKVWSALLIRRLHVRACAAHDHPFACALLEEIHPNTLTANVFSVPDPLFGDTAMGHGNIAEYLHVDRSNSI